MSNFTKLTRHPDTGEYEMATWMDNYYGRHEYGIKFSDGQVYREYEIIDKTKEGDA